MAELPQGFVRKSEQQAQEQPTQPLTQGDVPQGFVRASQAEAVAPMEQQDVESTFGQRINQLRKQRIEEVSRTFENYAQGNIGLGSALLQTVGKGGFGAANDLLGESFSTLLSAAVPDAIENPIKQYAADIMGDAYNSEVGQFIAKEWNELDPETQKNLQAGGNIMAWLAPKLKASKLGDKVKRAGTYIKRERLKNTLKLPDTPTNKIDESKRLFKEPFGFDEVVETTSKVPGVSPNKSFRKNIIAVGKEIEDLDKQLFRSLRKKSVDVPVDFIDDAVDLHLTTLLKNNQWIQSDRAIASAFDNNVKALQKVLRKYPNTPQGVLRARRAWDKMLKEDMLKLPDSEVIARDAVSKALRRSLNDVVERAAPYAPVKSTLKKQSQLYRALDNLSENYKLEKPPAVELKALVNRHPVIAAGILTGTGYGTSLASSPALLGAGALAAGSVGAYKGLPAALRGTGTALQQVGRATDLGRVGLDSLPVLRSGVFAGKEDEEALRRGNK